GSATARRRSPTDPAGPSGARPGAVEAGDERRPSGRPPPGLRGRALPAPARGAEPLHLLADLPQAAGPHRGDRGGQAAAAAVTGGIGTVLGQDVAYRGRGERGRED